MQFIFLIFISLCCSIGYSQNIKTGKREIFYLKGNITGRDTGYIILRFTDNREKWVSDTTYLQKGKFEFTGKINQPTTAVIKGYPVEINFDEANYVNLFLEPGDQYVWLTENAYENIKMIGSKTQEEYDALKMKFDSVKFLSKNRNDEFLKSKKDFFDEKNDSIKIQKGEKSDSLFNELRPTFKSIENVSIDFIFKHPRSYLSPYFLGIYLYSLALDSAELLYNRFSPEIKNSRDGNRDKVQIAKAKQNLPGAIAPNFNAIDFNGNEISLSKLKGNFVLLDFWASWCLPCIENIPQLQKLYNQYHVRQFEILTISIDRNNKDWEDGVVKEKIGNWYNVLVNDEIRKNYLNIFKPIPSQILIDRKGKIIWTSNDKDNKKGLEIALEESISK